MSNMTLYDAAEELATLLDTREGIEDAAELAAFDAEMEPAFERALRKVEGFAHFLEHLKKQAEFAAEEIERLRARKRRFEGWGERLREYAVRSMQAAGVSRMEAPTVTLAIQKNPGRVAIDDELALPPRYKDMTVKMPVELWLAIGSILDAHDTDGRFKQLMAAAILCGEASTRKSEIAAAIRRGEEVPGARIEESHRLVIR